MMKKTVNEDGTVYGFGTIEERPDWIRITIPSNGDGVTLESGLRHGLADSQEDEAYGNAVDGFESLLLAFATAGVELGTPAVSDAIQTALEAIGNNF